MQHDVPVLPDATTPDSVPETSGITEPVTPEQPIAPAANPAVIALLNSAHSEANAGRMPTAIAAVERALRIEPRNPVLWQELARLKLQKGEYQQAENFAARANSWARGNKRLLAENWRVISEARSLRGDNVGSRAALLKAKEFEQSGE